MSNLSGYKVIAQAEIVAILPATVREIAEKLGRDANTLYERLNLMETKGIIHVGETKRKGNNQSVKVYYAGTIQPSQGRHRRQTSADRELTHAMLLQEVKQLGETIEKTNDPRGLQYGVPAPLDTELLLLTAYGKFIVGPWKGLPGDLYVAWAVLPTRNLNSEMLLARKLSLIPPEEN
jgi:hypothetical protein